ncbi:hypothetical protein K458DRAFT_425393 [Lentithecium fluviatile CBS 122367]|uniref:AA1-like domain-containing protein n=1 Tax=Lentithecium fluviatile CBS 122367 TaxID=1168545 RepID=A0A6G1JLR3_9PLEO|nr:hypothetical protein K458DRAFT_425393 [Lentithecium fluviatile CBS 122367]
MRLTSLPILLLPLASTSTLPAIVEPASCHTPSFHLTNISYTANLVFSTPAHLAISSATLSFTFLNPAAFPAFCGATSRGGPSSDTSSYFQWPQTYECDEYTEEPGEVVSGSVEFGYLHVGGVRSLEVNETWTCEGFNYFASVNLTLALDCETTVWQNPNFTWPNNGELYRTENVVCEPIDISIGSDTVLANTVKEQME